MKTILLAPLPPPNGGIATLAARMTSAKLKNNWSYVVVDEKPIGRGVFGKANKRKYLQEIKRCNIIWKNLKKELADPEVKVVHSNIPSVATSMLREYVCARITKKKGRKFVIHFHCTIPNTTNGKFAWFLLKKLCKISDMIFVLNSQSQTCLNKITNTPIKTIPNFVNENEIVESRRINNDLKTVLYVGGIIESKGISDILKTAQRMPELSFRLIGEGENCFKDYALKSNLNNVIFTGPKDKNGVIDELKNADVFLFLSHFDGEGFSVALTEAMASGLPCIVTDWAANADMIGENGGVITKVGDIDAVVNAFNMIKPYNVRKKQSEANIQKVMLCYNDKVVLDMFVDAYEEMLTKKYE